MKKFKTIIIALIAAMTLAGCTIGNRTLFDTTYVFSRAIISLPDGTIIEGKVQNWTDYESGDQIQVKIDGTTYLVHAADIALIAE